MSLNPFADKQGDSVASKGVLRKIEFKSDMDLLFGLLGVLNHGDTKAEYKGANLTLKFGLDRPKLTL